MVLEKSSFQEYDAKTFSDGFQDFLFEFQHIHLSKEHMKF